jgi:hypothetical protein
MWPGYTFASPAESRGGEEGMCTLRGKGKDVAGVYFRIPSRVQRRGGGCGGGGGGPGAGVRVWGEAGWIGQGKASDTRIARGEGRGPGWSRPPP